MLIRSAEQDIERVLYTEKAIAARVEEIGTELTKKLGDKRPVLVCVLKGASFFYIDLCRCMNCAIDMDFISVSSYGAGAQSTGVVRLIKDLDNNITGRDVVIVEDIIDSGLTMHYLKELLSARKPASPSSISPPVTIRASRPISAALRFQMNLWSGTALITRTTTGTFPISVFCAPSAISKSGVNRLHFFPQSVISPHNSFGSAKFLSCFFRVRLLTKAVRNDSIRVQTNTVCPPCADGLGISLLPI